LRQHRGDEELRIKNRDSFGETLERFVDRHAEGLLVVDQLELRSDRLGDFVGDHL